MAIPPKSQVVMADFPGLVEAVDPQDVPHGAGQDQVNLTCLKAGTLGVRQGVRFVSFEPES